MPLSLKKMWQKCAWPQTRELQETAGFAHGERPLGLFRFNPVEKALSICFMIYFIVFSYLAYGHRPRSKTPKSRFYPSNKRKF
jgi:hypothetical protein